MEELKKEFPDEGMNGIDPRYVINRISSAIIRKEVPSINALDVLRSLKDGLGSACLHFTGRQEKVFELYCDCTEENMMKSPRKKFKKRLSILMKNRQKL